MKIPKRLEPLIDEGLVEKVIRPLMSGKEADVYIVSYGDELRIAKVYKEAGNRSFRQREVYTEGRKSKDSRRARAMKRGSRYGKQVAEEDWQSAEVTALYRLAACGVRVPSPLGYSNGVLIMEMVVDEDGEPAPRLNDVELGNDNALKHHEFMMRQVVLMLCEGLIHGDLSEYNVLLGTDGPVVIDLPQAVEAASNNSAKAMLLRDVGNMRSYFGQFAPELRKSRYGEEIWRLFESGKLDPGSPLTGVVTADKNVADVHGIMAEIDAERYAAQGRMAGASTKAERKRAATERLRGKVDESWVDDSTPLEEAEEVDLQVPLEDPTGKTKGQWDDFSQYSTRETGTGKASQGFNPSPAPAPQPTSEHPQEAFSPRSEGPSTASSGPRSGPPDFDRGPRQPERNSRPEDRRNYNAPANRYGNDRRPPNGPADRPRDRQSRPDALGGYENSNSRPAYDQRPRSGGRDSLDRNRGPQRGNWSSNNRGEPSSNHRGAPGRMDSQRGGPGRPHFDRNGGGRPNFDRNGGGRPNFDRNDGRRPNFDRNDGRRPNFDRNAGGRPNFDRDGGGRPNFDRNGGGRPNFDRNGGGRPNFDRNSGGRPNFDRNAGGRPNFDRNDRGRNDSHRPDLRNSSGRPGPRDNQGPYNRQDQRPFTRPPGRQEQSYGPNNGPNNRFGRPDQRQNDRDHRSYNNRNDSRYQGGGRQYYSNDRQQGYDRGRQDNQRPQWNQNQGGRQSPSSRPPSQGGRNWGDRDRSNNSGDRFAHSSQRFDHRPDQRGPARDHRQNNYGGQGRQQDRSRQWSGRPQQGQPYRNNDRGQNWSHNSDRRPQQNQSNRGQGRDGGREENWGNTWEQGSRFGQFGGDSQQHRNTRHYGQNRYNGGGRPPQNNSGYPQRSSGNDGQWDQDGRTAAPQESPKQSGEAPTSPVAAQEQNRLAESGAITAPRPEGKKEVENTSTDTASKESGSDTRY